jgi:hypothetical protein
MYKLLLLSFLIILSGCSIKQPEVSKSTTIIFKTPTMKFYDQGFVNKYDDHINLQVFTTGKLALNLFIYENRICKSTFECISAKQFNREHLSGEYKDSCLYDLFSEKNINFRDRENNILIKVKEN